MNELSRTIEAELKKTQVHPSQVVKSDAARSLEIRKWVHSWNDFCIYDGWWKQGRVCN